MAIELDAWRDELAGARGPASVVLLESVAQLNPGTSSGAFPAITNDGRWWVKVLDNPSGSRRIPITEFIVGKVSTLIQAPTCEVAVVEVPPELAGEPYAPGYHLKEGLAVGSRDVPGAVEGRELAYRTQDENRRRHAGVFALYDWCWGCDPQWLFAFEADNRTHSHDHGYYLPGRPDWSVPDLRAEVDVPRVVDSSGATLDTEALEDYATRLDLVTREEIRGMLTLVPPEWPVTQHELEVVGWFLERRARAVVMRLRHLAEGIEGGRDV